MRRSRLRKFTVIPLFALAFAFAFSGGVATAGQAVSAYGYYTVNGVDYKNWAAVNTNPGYNHQAYSVTLVSPTNKSIAGGWAGAAPRIYKNGALVCSEGYTYNSGTLAKNGVLNPAGCFYNTVAVWYTQGVTRGWTGSGYASYWTFNSPSQNS